MTITPLKPSFKQAPLQLAAVKVQEKPENKVKKESLLDKFHSATKNSSDMTDTIVVPRTIFKGYLGIMTGTVLATLGGLSAAKAPKTSKVLSVIGLLTSFYGTYAFVRPFVIKDAPGVEKKK